MHQDRRYPIGPYQKIDNPTPDLCSEWLSTLTSFPEQLRLLVGDLNEHQLQARYREGSWTVRQIIHHWADSHMQSLTRVKWALTEDTPVIKAYYEDRWALLQDYIEAPIDYSLTILEGVHARLVYLLSRLTDTEYNKAFIHPETQKTITIRDMTHLYAWHSQHHLAHIQIALTSPIPPLV